jgi:nucleoside phosphorylase
MNPGPAALQTERLLTRWSPRTVVMLGIAAGIHSDVRVGDVVIASQVDNYLDSSRAEPGSTPEAFEFSLGGTVFHADFDFLTQVRNFEFAQEQAFTGWRQACAQELAELVPKEKVRTALVEKGLVREAPSMLDAHLASGPVVGAAQQFTEWLRSRRDRNLKALEMESAGLMAAAMRRVEPARTLIIRGISDYGDKRKKQLDKVGEGALRRYAMRNATCLLLRLMETGVLPGLAAARSRPGHESK